MCREDAGIPFETSPMPEGEYMSPWVGEGGFEGPDATNALDPGIQMTEEKIPT